jgi:hypothetical protein
MSYEGNKLAMHFTAEGRLWRMFRERQHTGAYTFHYFHWSNSKIQVFCLWYLSLLSLIRDKICLFCLMWVDCYPVPKTYRASGTLCHLLLCTVKIGWDWEGKHNQMAVLLFWMHFWMRAVVTMTTCIRHMYRSTNWYYCSHWIRVIYNRQLCY